MDMRCAIGLVVGALLFSCRGGEAGPPDATYEVRGRVVEVTGSGSSTRALVAHEAIADFKDRDGKVSGMPAMEMAFGVSERVDPKTLEAGATYQLAFEVRWKQEPALLITGARPVPNAAP